MTDILIPCPKCKKDSGKFLEVGSASGRPFYRCQDCGHGWQGKNPAAVALGSLGGKARAVSLSPETRSQMAEGAANARWKAEKAKKNGVV